MGSIARLVLGLIAKSLHGGRAQHGFIVTILIGLAGALVGGWAASKFGIAAGWVAIRAA